MNMGGSEIMKLSYTGVDFKRAFMSNKIPLCILLISFALLYGDNSSTLVWWIKTIASNSTLLIFACMIATIPYSASLCEDTEFCYDRQMVIKNNPTSYIFSKIIMSFFTTYVTMFFGYIFSCIYKYFKDGLITKNQYDMASDYRNNEYMKFFDEGNIFIFTFLVGLHIAMFAGVISVIAVLCSIFIKNKIFVYIIPGAIVCAQYMLEQKIYGMRTETKTALFHLGINSIFSETISWQYYYTFMAAVIVVLSLATAAVYTKKLR